MFRNPAVFSRIILSILLLSFSLPTLSETQSKESASETLRPDQLIEEKIGKAIEKQDFSRKGADTCLKCHDQGSKHDASGIFQTVHGQSSGPFQDLQCEACHGPGNKHAKNRLRKGETRAPMITFGLESPVSSEHQNQTCLNCHQNKGHKEWFGGAHESADLPCASCHSLHKPKDIVLEKSTERTVCESCHRNIRAELHMRSSHPIKWGQMSCSDCHNPHGSMTEASLHKNTLNDNCYSCHAEKRGPFLWEHAPVSEDCSLCHTAHGSVNTALLKTRTPLLCQQCHSQSGHPSVGYQGTGAARGNISGFVAGKSCLNCHNQIHGSDHPSGNMLMR